MVSFTLNTPFENSSPFTFHSCFLPATYIVIVMINLFDVSTLFLSCLPFSFSSPLRFYFSGSLSPFPLFLPSFQPCDTVLPFCSFILSHFIYLKKKKYILAVVKVVFFLLSIISFVIIIVIIAVGVVIIMTFIWSLCVVSSFFLFLKKLKKKKRKTPY